MSGGKNFLLDPFWYD